MTNELRLDDEKVYEWRFETQRGVLLDLLSLALIPFVTYRGLQFVAKVWPAGVFWIVAVLAGVMMLVVIVEFFGSIFGSQEDRVERRNSVYYGAIVCVGMLAFLIESSAGFLRSGLTVPEDTHRWTFMLFYADNILRVMLLDIPEVYELSLSAIVPTSWPARTAVLLFRVAVGLGLIELGLRVVAMAMPKHRFQGTVREACHYGDSLPHDEFTVHRVGEVTVIPRDGSWPLAEVLNILKPGAPASNVPTDQNPKTESADSSARS